jgi:hypothetical protein
MKRYTTAFFFFFFFISKNSQTWRQTIVLNN